MSGDDETKPPGDGSPLALDTLLYFELDGEGYGFPVADVAGVISCGNLRAVPGASASVLGLTEWRGAVLTVLDLPRLLGRETPEAPACLVRLGPPLAQTAFFLPATVQLIEVALDGNAGNTLHESKPVRRIDPVDLVRALENEMRSEA